MEIDDVKEKQCTRCKKVKLFEEFSKSKHGKYGFDSRCKACKSAEAAKRWRASKSRQARPKKPEEKIGSGAAVLKKLMQKTGALPRAAADKPDNTPAADRLAGEHWSYIEGLLKVHLKEVGDISCIEFHYKSAFIHGYKHGLYARDAF